MGYSKPNHLIEQSTNQTKKLIQERGHIFISGKFHNRESVLVVFCPVHKERVTTTFYNYNRSQPFWAKAQKGTSVSILLTL